MQNLDDILKMAQNVQAKMADAQSQLDGIEVEGVSGGGLVRVKATAKGTIRSVQIDDSLMVPGEKSILEDLIAAALNDTRAKADQAGSEHMKSFAGDLPLPPGFELPGL